MRALTPFFSDKPGIAFRSCRLAAPANEFMRKPPPGARIGVIFKAPRSPAAMARAARYGLIVAGSSWIGAREVG
jgi:hypothetical protein